MLQRSASLISRARRRLCLFSGLPCLPLQHYRCRRIASSASVFAAVSSTCSNCTEALFPGSPSDVSAECMKRVRVPVVAPMDRTLAECTISLSQQEHDLIELLERVVRRLSPSTVVRLAGGWVRDKLLGLPNHDIDVALSDVTGQEFAEKVNQLLEEEGETTHSIAVIAANPAQSKHLETATVHVLGLSIDFVNLRAEEYASESRIPTMHFGTAQEDAERRDFTVNSLFFNVNDRSVEDWTGRGYADLRAGRIRTPLSPRTTLLDDPLRVLRAVRFGSRYGFRLAANLVGPLSSSDVRSALLAKVSRERVGTELDGMLLGPRPVGAVQCLAWLGLIPVMFPGPAGDGDEGAHDGGAGGGRRRGEESDDAAIAVLPYRPWDIRSSEHAQEICDAGMRVVDGIARIAAEIGDRRSGGDGPSQPAGGGVPTEEQTVQVRAPRDPHPAARRDKDRDGEKEVAEEKEEEEEEAGDQPHLGTDAASRWLRPKLGLRPPLAVAYGLVALSRSGADVADADGAVAGAGEIRLGDVDWEAGKERLRLLLLSAILWPWRNRTIAVPDGKGRPKEFPAADALIRCAIKRKNADARAVVTLHKAAEAFPEIVHDIQDAATRDDKEAGPSVDVRRSLGRWLCVGKDLWPLAMLLAVGAELVPYEVLRKVAETVDVCQLDGCWAWKPHLSGNDLQKRVGVKKGPAIGALMALQKDWMMQSPNGSTDELVEFLRLEYASNPNPNLG